MYLARPMEELGIDSILVSIAQATIYRPIMFHHAFGLVLLPLACLPQNQEVKRPKYKEMGEGENRQCQQKVCSSVARTHIFYYLQANGVSFH